MAAGAMEGGMGKEGHSGSDISVKTRKEGGLCSDPVVPGWVLLSMIEGLFCSQNWEGDRVRGVSLASGGQSLG